MLHSIQLDSLKEIPSSSTYQTAKGLPDIEAVEPTL